MTQEIKDKIMAASAKHESATQHEGLGPAIFNDGAVFGYPLASNEERWIPVGEGLPEDTVEVLTASNEGPNDMPDWYFHVASIHGRKEWVTGTDTLYFVTHWRKLPSPPNQQLK